jgi:transcriptional regulator
LAAAVAIVVPLALRQETTYPAPVEVAEEQVDADRMNLPQGSLDLLVLKTLALEPLHGWAVSERLGQMSGRAVQVRQGSLYPALHRLERRGWIRARWGTSENNRRAKYYELTRAGRKRLDTESEAWKRLTTVVSQVLDTP